MKTNIQSKTSSLLTLIVALSLPLTGRAGLPGSVDRSFKSGLAAYGLPYTTEQMVYTTERQADGKILVGGTLQHPDSSKPSHLYRLNANGSVDTAFNRSGIGANGDVRAIVVLGDGKIMIGGSFTSYNGAVCNRIARLNANGSLDTTFARTAGAPDGSINTILRLPSGKFMVGGSFTSFGVLSTAGLVRMHPDGSMDNTFNPAGRGFNQAVQVIKLLRDGNVLVGGDFTFYNGYRRERVAKMTADGALIFTQFLTASGANGSVRAMMELPDGKVLLGGNFTAYMQSSRPYLMSVDANGFPASLPELAVVDGGVQNILLQRDGRIVISGNFGSVAGEWARGIARLTSTGRKDIFLVPSGMAAGVPALCSQPDGKIIAGGLFDVVDSYPSLCVVRLESTISTAIQFSGIVTPALLNDNLGGSITFSLTSTGSLSGRFRSGVNDNAFTGTFADGLTYSGVFTGAAGERFNITLRRNKDEAGTNYILGEIFNARGRSVVRATAAHYDATYLRATHLQGLHTAILDTPRSPGTRLPNGISYFTQQVGANGVVTVAASLADGTTATATGILDASDKCQLYLPLATNRASLCGEIHFLGHDLDENVTGLLRWRKAAAVTTTTDNGLDINDIYEVHGSDYQTTSGFGLSSSGPSTAGTFVMYGGHVSLLTQDITIRSNTSLVIGTRVSDLRLDTLRGTASSGTCTVPMLDGTGRFVNRTGTIRGVFVHGTNRGFGWISIAGGTASEVRSSAFEIFAR
jgi:uncharacterized delta-60 repeat protein